MIQEAEPYIAGYDYALDCGAGIGRIAKQTLLPRFDNVDLLEPASIQLDQAKIDIPNARNFYCEGMQEHKFQEKYDCIWIQWCVGYLTDIDLVEFFKKCKTDGLSKKDDGKTGLIFVKDNAC